MLKPKTNTLTLLLIPVLAGACNIVFAGESVSDAVTDEKITSIRYTKEELAEAAHPNFIKTRDLSHVLSEKITLLAHTLTQRQGGSNNKLYEMAAATTQMTHEQYMKRLGTMVYDPNSASSSYTKGDDLRLLMTAQSRKTVEVKFKEAVPFVEEIRKGFNFKYSFNKRKGEAAPAASSTPDIRYGLVVADIQPASAPGVASLGTAGDLGLEYATPARVVYTIDRIDDQPVNRKVFPAATPNPTDSFTPTASANSVWRRPSTDLDIKVEAANSADTVSDKVTDGAIPGGKVTIAQADGLYAAQLLTNSHLGKEGVFHELKLPILGEANIARRMDERGKPIQTSFYNVLVVKNAPTVNIHYLNSEDRFKSEFFLRGTTKTSTYDLGITAEPRVSWAPGQRMGEKGDKVSLSLVQNF